MMFIIVFVEFGKISGKHDFLKIHQFGKRNACQSGESLCLSFHFVSENCQGNLKCSFVLRIDYCDERLVY